MYTTILNDCDNTSQKEIDYEKREWEKDNFFSKKGFCILLNKEHFFN